MLKKKADNSVTMQEMDSVGTSEDYFRVSSNFTTLCEMTLAELNALPVEQVFTFGSTKMPVVAIAMATKRAVNLYCESDAAAPFDDAALELLGKLGVKINVVIGSDVSKSSDAINVINVDGASDYDVTKKMHPNAHAILSGYVLYITSTSMVPPSDILVIRKRLATPITNPMAEEILQKIAGVTVTANKNSPSEDSLAEFHAHLQTMSGTAANTACNPVCFTAGLPATCAVWVELINRGGLDCLMASTAYGGSSQLTDLLAEATPQYFKKWQYHIQGAAGMIESIRSTLNEMAACPDLKPVTVLFSEIPTNPDMKVPDLQDLVNVINEYRQKTGKEFIMMIDVTFAPSAGVLEKFEAMAPDLTALSFISMSKSVSRGLTCAGTIIANKTDAAIDLVNGIRKVSTTLDTVAKPDQLVFLCDNHAGVKQRCLDAYEVARAVGDSLCSNVLKLTEKVMGINFVSTEHAKIGFTSSTFSFNLPSPQNTTDEINAALAQQFVDEICTRRDIFKPCVSFGQDNGLVYATVPATSTQGAIKEEDKAKQAVGGVQLVRLSFAPTVPVNDCNQIIAEALQNIYSNKKARK